MRILRLDLERYGHVSGETLAFPAEQGLHVVLGANEAGKSTALEALADGLFGFHAKESRKLHHPDDPRVGFTLQAADGTEARFVRRRKSRDNLLDAAGTPVPDVALARFLGGTSRKRFREMFGLDGERLRQGGRTILTEHGETGAAVLQAQTGLHGLRGVVDRLDEEAKTLFGDGRGARRISKAAAAIRDYRRDMAERSLSGADYAKATATEAALSGDLERIRAEAADLRRQQARLDRTRRTAPVRGALAAARDGLAALGAVPALPEDAAARSASAQAAREQAARDLTRDRERAAVVQDRLAALRLDPLVLTEAAAITAMAADLSRIEQARVNRLTVAGQAAERLRELDETAVLLKVPERGAALRLRLPDAATLRRADRLLKQQTERAGRRAAAAETLRRMVLAAGQAEGARDSAPDPEALEKLRDALEAANREGAIDAALADAASQERLATMEATVALAGLALWSGDLTRLETSPVPLDADILRLGKEIEVSAGLHAAAAEALATHDRASAACRVTMAGLQRSGTLPTADAIAAIRGERDAAWGALRRLVAEGAAVEPGLPAELDRLLHAADELADRRTTEAVRVAEWEALLDDAARLAAARDGLVAAQANAQGRLDAAWDGWRQAWAPAGVQPLDPPAMRDWVRARAAVLTMARTAREAAAKHRSVAERHAALAARLRAVAPDAEAHAMVADLRQAAARRLKLLDDAAARHTAAVEAGTRAASSLAEARQTLSDIEGEHQRWLEEWAPIADRLGLPGDADVEDAADALALWRLAEVRLGAWSEKAMRVQEMAHALDLHAVALDALAARLGVPVSTGLVAELAARLAGAQQAQSEQDRLAEERDRLAGEITGHQRAAQAAEDVLHALRRLAGAADDTELAATIARVAEKARLTTAIHDRTAELHQLDDGRTEADLAVEAVGIDIDAIPGRLAEIAGRLAELDAEAIAVAGERADIRTKLHRMEEGQDVTGPAQAVQDALAEIEDAAHRYVRLRLAHALLRGGIEGFRRSQQGPLLAAASALFAELTSHRYDRLEQDEGDRGEPVIIAVRPDGSTCPADQLSEGTRDQLFLALRLASIRLEAAVSDPLPFIADDLLVNFDDNRAAAALRLLARFGRETQVILFTHHAHLAALLEPGSASLHRLPAETAAA